jgi:hypothetical protein
MLILAGLVLNLIFEGGIFDQAEIAVELTRLRQLQGEILKWKQEVKIIRKVGGIVKTAEEKMDEMVEAELLTERERDLLKKAHADGNRI